MFHDVSILFMLYKIGEVFDNQNRTNGFEQKIHCLLSMLSSKPENWSFHVVILMSTREKCLTIIRAAIAA